MAQKTFYFVSLENDHQLAQSKDFSTIEGRDEIMQHITLWFRMNKERYKIISDSFAHSDQDPKHRIVRFLDREQHRERVFTYKIIQRAA